MEQNTLISNQACAGIYRLLSACYYQPEEAFLEEDVFGQLQKALTETDGDLAPFAERMDQAFRRESPEALLQDYARLFLGPFEIPAKPYGSVYLDGEKVVMGDSTINVLSCYRQGGFVLAGDFREMPDHVAAELEYLYLLTFRENEALRDGDAAGLAELTALKKAFLQNHLGRWISPFAAAVRDAARTDFYRHLAELTESFVRRQADAC